MHEIPVGSVFVGRLDERTKVSKSQNNQAHGVVEFHEPGWSMHDRQLGISQEVTRSTKAVQHPDVHR